MALAGRRLDRKREKFSLEPERDIHEGNEHRHLHQRPDDRGKGLPRIEAEDDHRYSNGELKMELERRDDIDMHITVDRTNDPDWKYNVGFVPPVTEQKAPRGDMDTYAIVCGPPVMIKFTQISLEKLGYDHHHIILSLENRMKCGIGMCGRCNIGRELVCAEPTRFSSGYSINEQAGEILRRGCRGFIQKPFKITGLSGLIRKVLDTADRRGRRHSTFPYDFSVKNGHHNLDLF